MCLCGRMDVCYVVMFHVATCGRQYTYHISDMCLCGGWMVCVMFHVATCGRSSRPTQNTSIILRHDATLNHHDGTEAQLRSGLYIQAACSAAGRRSGGSSGMQGRKKWAGPYLQWGTSCWSMARAAVDTVSSVNNKQHVKSVCESAPEKNPWRKKASSCQWHQSR